MAIRIITDSAADYSAQEIEKRQITCIPMTVTFGEKEYPKPGCAVIQYTGHSEYKRRIF